MNQGRGKQFQGGGGGGQRGGGALWPFLPFSLDVLGLGFFEVGQKWGTAPPPCHALAESMPLYFNHGRGNIVRSNSRAYSCYSNYCINTLLLMYLEIDVKYRRL